MGEVREEKEAVRRIISFMTSHKALFLLWLVVGIMTLIRGHISRISYGCVWVVLLMEYVARILIEKD